MPGLEGEVLEGENPFQSFDDRRTVQQTKDELKAQALKFASLYHAVFTQGAGKQLLEHWSVATRHRKIAPNASASELSYHNGVREFVEGIHVQIEFAKTGGASTSPDDIWFNT